MFQPSTSSNPSDQPADAAAPRCVVSQVSWPREIAWQPTESRWPQRQRTNGCTDFVGKWYGFCRPQEKGAFVTFVVIGSWLVG